MYRVELSPGAPRSLKRLPTEVVMRIDRQIVRLSENPRPRGTVKLTGEDNVYRIRAGDYRILYEVFDRRLVVYVLDVGHRREIYRTR